MTTKAPVIRGLLHFGEKHPGYVHAILQVRDNTQESSVSNGSMRASISTGGPKYTEEHQDIHPGSGICTNVVLIQTTSSYQLNLRVDLTHAGK